MLSFHLVDVNWKKEEDEVVENPMKTNENGINKKNEHRKKRTSDSDSESNENG